MDLHSTPTSVILPWLYGVFGKNRKPVRVPLTREQMLSLVDHHGFGVVTGPFADWDALMDYVEGGGTLLDGEAAVARGRELRDELRAAWLASFAGSPTSAPHTLDAGQAGSRCR